MELNTIHALLLDCLSHAPDRMSGACLEQLSSSDWEVLLEQVAIQRVSPLLYQRLKERDLDVVVPAAIMQTLHELYLPNSARNLRLYHELGEIVRTLQAANIPVIVLKGAYLAKAVYGNIALRPMVDIDLMVPQSDVPLVVEKLLALGYSPLSQFWIEAQFATSPHLPRFMKPGAVGIKVHWTITSPRRSYCIEVDELWARSSPVTLAGVEVLGLCPEDLLLHLCLHTSYQHQFTMGLRPFCDIAETIRCYGDNISWEHVRQRADQWRWRRGVYLALYLAREFVDAAVPDEVLHGLKPADFGETIVAAAKEQVFTDKAMAVALSTNLAPLWGPKRLWDKAVYLFKILFPPTQVMSTKYSASPDSPRIYLYYPVRLRDLLVRHGPMTWRLLRGDREMTPLAERKNTLWDWLAEG